MGKNEDKENKQNKGEDKKEEESSRPEVNEELDGFDININSFGEITSNYSLDKINKFLNRSVDDKKLRDRDDVPKDEEEEEDASEEDQDDAEERRWGKSD